MKKKALMISSLVFIVVIIAIFFSLNQHKESDIPGYIEANLSYLATNNINGELKKLAVKKGQKVNQGDLLFAIDPTPYALKTQQDLYLRAQQNANFQNLLTGKRPAYIEQTQANIDQEKANIQYLKKTYTRYKKLVKSDSISQENLDQATSQLHQAQEHLKSLQLQLTIYQLKARQQEINAAKNAASASQAQLALSQWQQQQATVYAPQDGIIFDTYYWEGEQVQGFHPVVSLLVPKRAKLVFFIPQDLLSQIKLNQEITFSSDNDKTTYNATISYISPQAQYTPPVIYSDAARQSLSYKIEARLNPTTQSGWHPGQAVNVHLKSRS